MRNKVTDGADAASLVRDGDSVLISGFVCQGVADSVLRHLEKRFMETGHPNELTLMFYGCGDPGGERGTNRFRHKGMLRRVVASHFGQSPDLHTLIFNDEIEAYSLPMGSIARMVRSRASGTPGHFTKVGLGTFVDPRNGGGKLNQVSNENLVEVIELDGQEYLRYKPISANVGIIRATTADPEGNLSIERESVSPDTCTIASAVRASGGIVISQVDRIADQGSLRLRDIKVPGALVDCVVAAQEEDIGMSFYTKYDPSWSGEIRKNIDRPPALPLNPRKLIARRGALELRPDDIVNLGIGMPEGLANVCAEEQILQAITLTTEAGMIGGIGASGRDFGPAINAKAMLDINQQFDFYNGGGLDVCFLGAAEVDAEGNVNVSKLGADKLTGPGGFIDITQSTHRVCFLGTFTKKGMRVEIDDSTKRLCIEKDGEVPMFRKSTQQITFNAHQAQAHAQNVLYITERAVFKLTMEGIQLVEVAPGIDIERDILQHMEFAPVIDEEILREMDPSIFSSKTMGLKDSFYKDDLAGMETRFHFRKDTNTVFIDMRGIIISRKEELDLVLEEAEAALKKLTNGGNNKVNVVSTYDRADISPDIMEDFQKALNRFEEKYYLTVRRLAGKAFTRQKIFKQMHLLDNKMLWEEFSSGEKEITRTQFKEKTKELYQIHLTDRDIVRILGDLKSINEEEFNHVLQRLNECLSSNMAC